MSGSTSPEQPTGLSRHRRSLSLSANAPTFLPERPGFRSNLATHVELPEPTSGASSSEKAGNTVDALQAPVGMNSLNATTGHGSPRQFHLPRYGVGVERRLARPSARGAYEESSFQFPSPTPEFLSSEDSEEADHHPTYDFRPAEEQHEIHQPSSRVREVPQRQEKRESVPNFSQRLRRMRDENLENTRNIIQRSYQQRQATEPSLPVPQSQILQATAGPSIQRPDKSIMERSLLPKNVTSQPNLFAPVDLSMNAIRQTNVVSSNNLPRNVISQPNLFASGARAIWNESLYPSSENPEASSSASQGQSTTPSTPSSANPHRSTARKFADIIRGIGDTRGGTPASDNPSGSQRSTRQLQISTPQPMMERAPDFLLQRWSAHLPAFREIYAHVPFVHDGLVETAFNYGVVKITNVPHRITKEEVMTILGPAAAVVAMPRGSQNYAIHFVMDRLNGKMEQDVYIEVMTPHEAQQATSRLIATPNRLFYIGHSMQIQASSEEALMRTIFPRATNIRWQGPLPIRVPVGDVISQDSARFITHEELASLVKFAEKPKISRFVREYAQRPYEAMISVLYKFPWSSTEMYTVQDRNKIFEATIRQIELLVNRYHHKGFEHVFNAKLMSSLVDAGLRAPGFSEQQRAQIIDATQGLVAINTFVTPLAVWWPFQTLRCRDYISQERVDYFAELLRKATTPLTREAFATPEGDHWRLSPFGNVISHLEHPDEVMIHMSMAQAMLHERLMMEALLQKAIAPPVLA